MEERERSLKNVMEKSDAGFWLRIPLMAITSRSRERQFEDQSAMFC